MYQHILVPTDGSEGATDAFDHAVDLALETGATLHVVHAVDSTLVPVEVSGAGVIEALREDGEELVSSLRQRGADADVAIETAVITGAPYQAILEYADTNDIDLIVMGSHGRTGLNRWLLGSVTERVVRRSTVPVLTVRHAGGD